MLVPSEIAKEMPDYIAAALFNALQANPESRTRSIEKFRDQLSTAPAVSRLREDREGGELSEEETEEPQEPEKKRSHAKYAILIVLAVFIFLLLAGGVVVLLLFPDLFSGSEVVSEPASSIVVDETTTTIRQTTRTASAKFATPDLVGKNFFDIRDNSLIGEMKVVVIQGLQRPPERRNPVPEAERRNAGRKRRDHRLP